MHEQNTVSQQLHGAGGKVPGQKCGYGKKNIRKQPGEA